MLDKIRIAIVSTGLLVGAAHAEPRDEAKQHVAAADLHYRLARFAEALAEYTRAYELYPVPALLFNIGQCHRGLGAHARAIFFFEGYLRDAPRASNRALVEDLIREARAAIDRPPAPAEAPPVDRPRVPPPIVVFAPPPPPVARAASWPADDPAPSRVWPGVWICGGAAAMAAGGAFYYYGQKAGPDEKYVYDDTRLLGGAMLALGGAAIVTGVILWRRASATVPVVALAADGGYLGWARVF